MDARWKEDEPYVKSIPLTLRVWGASAYLSSTSTAGGGCRGEGLRAGALPLARGTVAACEGSWAAAGFGCAFGACIDQLISGRHQQSVAC